ncbi:MAG: folate-binding protein [Candidatus Didemnitutus sp.]|nr:folate-binding protein [Candidatus Didemnitutus sp.]
MRNSSAVLRISGPDANTFLNGQFTQELRIISGQFAYGLWLNQKGKVLADSFVLRVGDNESLVFSPRAGSAALRERIEAYLIADEVDVVDETDRWVALGVFGEGVAAAVTKLGVPIIPARGYFASVDGAHLFAGRFTRAENFWWLAPRDSLVVWQQKLVASGAHEISFAAAEVARLRDAIPAVPDDIGAGDLPAEGGLDAAAISYTKGCYLGQEVVARLKNLGQVRRRLHLLRGTGEPPEPRTALYQGEQRVGELRSVAATPEGFLALAMLSLVTFDAARGLSLQAQQPLRAHVVPHG